jgi:hypothetical protein
VLELADAVSLFRSDGSNVFLKQDTHYNDARRKAWSIFGGACADLEIDLDSRDKKGIVHAFALAMAEKAAEAERLRNALSEAVAWHEAEKGNEPGASPLVDSWREALSPPQKQEPVASFDVAAPSP